MVWRSKAKAIKKQNGGCTHCTQSRLANQVEEIMSCEIPLKQTKANTDTRDPKNHSISRVQGRSSSLTERTVLRYCQARDYLAISTQLLLPSS